VSVTSDAGPVARAFGTRSGPERVALVAAPLGARGVAGLSMTIAKWLVIAFAVLAVVSLVL
jgi:uncharacterized membrane protein YtjA (UPF0391 family)